MDWVGRGIRLIGDGFKDCFDCIVMSYIFGSLILTVDDRHFRIRTQQLTNDTSEATSGRNERNYKQRQQKRKGSTRYPEEGITIAVLLDPSPLPFNDIAIY